MTNFSLRIAIDGKAATGKSTISEELSKELNLKYINTGQMYRLFAFIFKKNENKSFKDILKIIRKLKISFNSDGLITCEEIEFKHDELDSRELSELSSIYSAKKEIREEATKRQIELGKQRGILMEGRDIGTVIMPDADFKFFIDVDVDVAAKRRFEQRQENGEIVSYDEILNEIKIRNKRDENRKFAPLKPAKDAIIINSTNKTSAEIVAEIKRVIFNE